MNGARMVSQLRGLLSIDPLMRRDGLRPPRRVDDIGAEGVRGKRKRRQATHYVVAIQAKCIVLERIPEWRAPVQPNAQSLGFSLEGCPVLRQPLPPVRSRRRRVSRFVG